MAEDDAEVRRPLPLLHAWKFYVDAKHVPGSTPESYAESVRQIGQAATVQELWRYVHRLQHLPSGSNLRVFRADVAPSWEDPQNVGGGKWVVRSDKAGTEQRWRDLLLALAGGSLRCYADVCGAVLSVRKVVDAIKVWNRQAEAADYLGEELAAVLHVPPSCMEYQPHGGAIERNRLVSSAAAAAAASQPRVPAAAAPVALPVEVDLRSSGTSFSVRSDLSDASDGSSWGELVDEDGDFLVLAESSLLLHRDPPQGSTRPRHRRTGSLGTHASSTSASPSSAWLLPPASHRRLSQSEENAGAGASPRPRLSADPGLRRSSVGVLGGVGGWRTSHAAAAARGAPAAPDASAAWRSSSSDRVRLPPAEAASDPRHDPPDRDPAADAWEAEAEAKPAAAVTAAAATTAAVAAASPAATKRGKAKRQEARRESAASRAPVAASGARSGAAATPVARGDRVFYAVLLALAAAGVLFAVLFQRMVAPTAF